MRRKYVYKNAIIYILRPTIDEQKIHTATETFLKKVLKEKTEHDHINSPRGFET